MCLTFRKKIKGIEKAHQVHHYERFSPLPPKRRKERLPRISRPIVKGEKAVKRFIEFISPKRVRVHHHWVRVCLLVLL
jgi:hypothetical protein